MFWRSSLWLQFFFVGGKYILLIYLVELDHYGMPYRNTLCSDKFDITSMFNI